MAQLAGAHKDVGRDLQGIERHAVSGVAVDIAQQLADAHGISDTRMVLFRGRGQGAIEVGGDVSLASARCYAIAENHAHALPCAPRSLVPAARFYTAKG